MSQSSHAHTHTDDYDGDADDLQLSKLIIISFKHSRMQKREKIGNHLQWIKNASIAECT